MLGFFLRTITACLLVLELGTISAQADNAEVALLRGGADGLRERIQMLRRCREGNTFYFTTYMISDDIDQSPVGPGGSRLRIPLLRNLEVNFHFNSPEFAALVGEEIELRFATSQLVARSGRAYAPRACPWFFQQLFRSRTIFNML